MAATAHFTDLCEADSLMCFEAEYLRGTIPCGYLAQAAQSTPALSSIVVLPVAPEQAAFFGDTRSDACLREIFTANGVHTLHPYHGRKRRLT
jgi:hypothetical protein